MPAAAVPSCRAKPGWAASTTACVGPRSICTAPMSAPTKGIAMIARRAREFTPEDGLEGADATARAYYGVRPRTTVRVLYSRRYRWCVESAGYRSPGAYG